MTENNRKMETFYKTELDAVKAQLHSKTSEVSSTKLENDRLQVRGFDIVKVIRVTRKLYISKLVDSLQIVKKY